MKYSNTKRTGIIWTLLVGLAALSGYLLSKASLVGKAGITFLYKEYRFLKVWWQGALVVFGVWMALLLVHWFINRKLSRQTATLVYVLMLLVATLGLFLTYQDFRNDLSHRLLGERFHIGAYLFWIGWMIISLFYLFGKRDIKRSA